MQKSTIPITSTDRMGYSMGDRSLTRWRTVCAALVATCVYLSMSGCGSESAADDREATLTAAEAKGVLRKLPYRYEFTEVKLPQGASAAVAGRVYGRHHTWLTFGAAFGDHPNPVLVPGAQLGDVAGAPYFTYSSNLQEPGKRAGWKRGKHLHTEAQWNEAINIAFEMEQAFCRAVTGQSCPI